MSMIKLKDLIVEVNCVPYRIDMKRNKLKTIISECLSEVRGENINEFKLISLEDFLKSSLNEADFLGATTREVPDEEMSGYLKTTVAGEKTPKQRFEMPYVHASNIEIKDENDKTIDLEALKALIKTRPTELLKQNEKIQHSGGSEYGFTQFHNIGIPALKGLVVDERTNKFMIVDTCPGAGRCPVYCYARKGGYIQFPASSLSLSKVLNFLVNDPDGFSSLLGREISSFVSAGKRLVGLGSVKDIKHVIRWHDAGDFFSPDYLALAYSIARKFPMVDFYAYTKLASVALGEKPDNFIINFSMGAKREEEEQIDFTQTKNSTVVPKSDFLDLLKTEPGKGKKPKFVRDKKGRVEFKDASGLDTLKDRMAKKYKVEKDSILTYDELQSTPVSNELRKYNIIVRPKDGDDSASRKDVLGSYLLIH